MPWYAQRADLPVSHWMWADAGSDLEAGYVAVGCVVVREGVAAEVEVAAMPGRTAEPEPSDDGVQPAAALPGGKRRRT
ncbi:hypothetical protein Aglo03_25980 [Actinokineospora globicatena]|uniref:Uncharacterized protein n=2 Tax=Actinokineospora globicatena TaxID=103729 RepID=A0A9W6QLH1_9PSEU|nr:hypothetical protein Aglo03_25980 [Actinokineospora globicatena]